MDSNPPVVT